MPIFPSFRLSRSFNHANRFIVPSSEQKKMAKHFRRIILPDSVTLLERCENEKGEKKTATKKPLNKVVSLNVCVVAFQIAWQIPRQKFKSIIWIDGIFTIKPKKQAEFGNWWMTTHIHTHTKTSLRTRNENFGLGFTRSLYTHPKQGVRSDGSERKKAHFKLLLPWKVFLGLWLLCVPDGGVSNREE